MKSSLSKVLHGLCGRPVISYPLDLAKQVGSKQTLVVVGHQADQVKAMIHPFFPTVQFVMQEQQKGTGHAVQKALPQIDPRVEYVLILCGDAPLLQISALRALLQLAQGRMVTLLSAYAENPTGYGRLVREENTGRLLRIVEEKDCDVGQKQIREVNAGVYVIKTSFLHQALQKITPANVQKELYLTDVVAQAAQQREVGVLSVPFVEIQGVNDRADLASAAQVMRQRINQIHMKQGVTLTNPETTYIDADVTIGADTELGPGVTLRGKSRIGTGCMVDAGCILENTIVEDNCHIKPYTVMVESQIHAAAQVGPFSHLRPQSVVGSLARVGNFVEMKKTILGQGSKANHLSYLGDATIGSHVNIGCGTITCNYDGIAKYPTVIEDGAFVGSDTQLVAPVVVGKDAFVAAGTTVTQDVPPGALAISRAPQVNRLGYVEQKKKRQKSSSSK